MKIERIRLKNFMPFEDAEVQLGDVGIIGVEGQWPDSPQRSNRAGKSAFLEGLLYALYGKTRAVKDKAIRNSFNQDEPFWVEVDLLFPDGTEATIKRGREPDDGPILIFDDGVSVSGTNANELIENLVGFNYEEFIATHFFQQGDIDQFMRAKNKQKRELLLGWLPFLTAYQDAKEITLDELREVKAELKTAEALLGEEHDEEAYDAGVQELSKVRLAVKGWIGEIDAMERQEKKLNNTLTGYVKAKELNNKVEEYSGEVAEVKERLEEKKKQLDDARKALKKFNTSHDLDGPNEILATIKEGLDEDLEQVTTLKATLANLRGQEAELKKNKGICPILSEGCDRIKGDPAKLKRDIEKTEKQINKANKERNRLHKQYTDQEETISELGAEQTHLTSTVQSSNTQVELVTEEETRWVDGLEKAQAQLKEAGQFSQSKADRAKEKLETMQEQLTGFRGELADAKQAQGELEARLEALLQQQQARLKWEARAQGLEKRKRVLNFLSYAFGENGIMGKQVENVFADIQDDANFILSSMGLGLSIAISPFKLLESYDEECPACGTYLGRSKKSKCPSCEIDRPKKRKDELTLTITDEAQGGRTEGWEMDSGAGKTIITLAVRLAVSRMIQRMRSRSCGILVLDEVFAMLDPVNRDGLLNLLTAIKSQLGFEQIFVVSHTEIKDFIPDVLLVKRNEENIAELEWRQ